MKEMQINGLHEMANFTFTSKYAKFDEKKERRETWEETVSRVEKMHLKKYSFLNDTDKEKIKEAFNLVREKVVSPSMRSMQFGGKAIETKNERIFNCSVRHIDSLRSFAESFYMLLCGCGVGFGLSNRFLSRLPDLVDAKDKTGTVITYVVEDTLEGWADSIEALLNCYHKNTPYSGRKIVFDYSKIRPAGAKLKTSGGKAPGYKGLKNCLTIVKKLLDFIIETKGQTHLKTIDAYDILMHCADAVLSGGVRRSACSVVFDPSDEDMMNSKTLFTVKSYSGFDFDEKLKKWCGKVTLTDGRKMEVEIDEWDYNHKDNKNSLTASNKIQWRYVEPQRARSNNSAIFVRNKIKLEELKAIIAKTRQFGEPGFVFADHEDALFNPCFEIGFIPIINGMCAFQMCNLSSINGAKIKTKEDFFKAAWAASLIGTLQAGYTHFPYLGHPAEELTKQEALLGVSITGMMDSPDILFNDDFQKEAAKCAVETNKEWAAKLGIKQAARVTCVKPEGTNSIVLGAASGIHPHHAKKYFRRIQCNKIDNIYKYFRLFNEHACEPSVWSANKTDDVITFPIEITTNAIFKKDLAAIEHLNLIKKTQENWVVPGTTEANQKPLVHNVSCTVIVQENEWDEAIQFIYDNREYFAAVSFLGASGDKDYPQAPMEAVVTKEDEEKYEYLLKNWQHVDYKKLQEDDDTTNHTAEAACVGGACELTKV